MTTLLIVLQVFIIALLVLVILLQKTSADGLSGLSGGGSGIVSGRGVSTFFTRITAVLAAAFMINSLVLARIESNKAIHGKDLLDKIVNTEIVSPPPVVGSDENSSRADAESTNSDLAGEQTEDDTAIPDVPPAS